MPTNQKFKAYLERGMDGPEVVIDFPDDALLRMFQTVNQGTYLKITPQQALELRNALSVLNLDGQEVTDA